MRPGKAAKQVRRKRVLGYLKDMRNKLADGTRQDSRGKTHFDRITYEIEMLENKLKGEFNAQI